MPILCKIDVTKIDKARLYKGKSGTYLDCVLIENKEGADKYGNNFMIVQSVTKEEREQGIRGPIIGNAKHSGGKSASKPASQPASKPADDSDCPF